MARQGMKNGWGCRHHRVGRKENGKVSISITEEKVRELKFGVRRDIIDGYLLQYPLKLVYIKSFSPLRKNVTKGERAAQPYRACHQLYSSTKP